MTMPSVSIDQNVCMGSEYCVRAHPELFSLGDDGVATLADGGAGPLALAAGHVEVAQQASRLCPAGAIEFC